MNGTRHVCGAAAVLFVILAVLGCSAGPLEVPQQPMAPAPAAVAIPATAGMTKAPADPQPPLPAAPAATPVAAVAQPGAPAPAASAPPSRHSPAAAEPTPIPAVFPLTVASADGRDIVFERPPEKIVAYDSAVVEILFAIGEGERVAGTHAFVSYPPETESIPRVGDAFSINVEAVVELEPDLVYVFFERFVDDLEPTGLRVLYLPTLSQDFTKVADNVRFWGRIVGNPNAAEAVARDFEARVDAVRTVMEPIGTGPTVFQDVGGFWTPGRGTLIQEVFDLLKLENVAADVDGYVQLSPEVIVERDPTIIIGAEETILGESALAGVRAVRHGSIYTPSTDALSIAGPRFVDGIEELARWVYPALFR